MRTFSSFHPSVLLFYFASVLITTMFASNPVYQICSLAGGVLFLLCIKKRVDVFFYFLLFFIITVTNPLFSHNGATPLFFLNGNPITLEAFIYGAGLGITVIAALIWFKAMHETMTSDKFMCLFGGVIPSLALTLSITLRFVPLFIRRAKSISRAQKTVGYYSYESRADRIKNRGRVFISVISASLEQSIETAMSMKARGYGIKGRTNYSVYKFKSSDGVMLLICAAAAGLAFACSAAGKSDFYYYPVISAVPLSALSVLSYVSFFILTLLPFIIEIKEAIVWKYCVSKI